MFLDMSFIQQLFSFLQDNQLFFLIQHFMKGFVVIVTLWIYTFPPNESLIFLEPFSSSLPKTCGIISYHRGPTAARKLMTHSTFHMILDIGHADLELIHQKHTTFANG